MHHRCTLDDLLLSAQQVLLFVRYLHSKCSQLAASVIASPCHSKPPHSSCRLYSFIQLLKSLWRRRHIPYLYYCINQSVNMLLSAVHFLYFNMEVSGNFWSRTQVGIKRTASYFEITLELCVLSLFCSTCRFFSFCNVHFEGKTVV